MGQYQLNCCNCNTLFIAHRKSIFSRKMSLLNLMRATRKLQLTPSKYNIPRLLKFSTGNSSNDKEKEKVNFTFVKLSTGEKINVSSKVDTNILDALNENKIDAPGFGACEGTLACSTCTVHFSQEDFDRLDLSNIDDEEMDYLDKVIDVRDTSRLGCQVELTKEFEGITILIPEKAIDRRIIH